MMRIPRFVPSLDREMAAGILKSTASLALDKSKAGSGEFEKEFARYIGVKNAITVPSGRMGLFLILKNLFLKEQDAIILPSFTYWAVPGVVSFLKLSPTFVDIDIQTCNLDVRLIEKRVTQSTKAIIATHLYGMPCEMNILTEVARKHKLLIIEDCAQSCGAEYKGKKVGSMGEASYFSFGATKNLFLLGAGMVTTNNDELANRIRAEVGGYSLLARKTILIKTMEALAMRVSTGPFIFSTVLFPYLLLFNSMGMDIVDRVFSEREIPFKELPKRYLKIIPRLLQDNLGSKQLRRLGELNEKRIENARYLLGLLKEVKNLILPSAPGPGTKNIFTNFPVRVAHRDSFIRALLRKGVDTTRGFMNNFGSDCRNGGELQRTVLHLPMHSSLSKTHLLYISEAIKDTISG